MKIKEVRLQNFRNIDFASVDCQGTARLFLLGENGQGKSNFLEAVSLLTSLRSYRTKDLKRLLNWNVQDAHLLYLIEHEIFGDIDVEIKLSPQKKEVLIDGKRLNRFADFIGRFPVVPASLEDIMILRGGPADRRRFFDSLFSVTDKSYLEKLRIYNKGIKERNHLLKEGCSKAELRAFDSVLAPHAVQLCQLRGEGIAFFAKTLTRVYKNISKRDEAPILRYKPNCDVVDNALNWLEIWELEQEKDRVMKTSRRGPHRDDFGIELENHIAKSYASEGQQRSLVIALRLAQLEWFKERLGIIPVFLADDIFGELDAGRRQSLLDLIEQDFQIMAAGTTSIGSDWFHIRVQSGQFVPIDRGV